RAERIDARVIDQDVDMAASQLDGPSRERTGARGVAKIGRDEIGFPARYPYFGNRLFTAFRVAAYDHDMNTWLRRVVGHPPADSAGRSGDECCHRHSRSPSLALLAAHHGPAGRQVDVDRRSQ